MSVGAVVTVVILNNRGQDTKAIATMDSSAIDLTQDLADMDLTLTIPPPAPDVTSAVTAGHIQRVIRVLFGASWAESHPEPAMDRSIPLRELFSNVLAQRAPGVIDSINVVLF